MAKSSRPKLTPNLSRIRADWLMLCEQIGERRAGSDGEHRAAAYLRDQFAAAAELSTPPGDARIETFLCKSLRGGDARLQVRRGNKWVDATAQIVVGAPGTPGRGWVEGEIAWLEMPEDAPRLKRGSLAGKLAVLFGPMTTDPAEHRRLLAARPAAVIHVDERLPFPWVKNDGVYPYWASRYGWMPFVTTPYQDAWQWRRDGVRRLRLRSRVDLADAESFNVVCDLPGAAGEPLIIVSAHHDTQCNNVGADDNASGTVAVMELARLLAGRKRRRPIRLITFGTEEQLSVGSSAYVRAHRKELAGVGLQVNVDSISSPLGHTNVSFALGAAGRQWIERQLRRGGLTWRGHVNTTCFTDHFPFAASGVPTVDIGRGNMPGGRWQHHSMHDNLDNVSDQPLLEVLAALAPMLDRLASMPGTPPPFARDRDQDLDAALRENGRVYCGMR